MDDIRTALTLVRRELRGGTAGFRILIMALALGVAAIAAVQSVSHGLLVGLLADGRAILGGDLAVRQMFRDLEPGQLGFLRQQGPISHTVELRAMARAETGDAATLVELKAVDAAYPLYGNAALQSALPLQAMIARRGKTWGAVAEAGLLSKLGIAVGDRIGIGTLTVELRDVLETEPDRAGSASPIGFGPRLMISAEALPETGLTQPGSLTTHFYRLRLPASARPDAVRAELKATWPKATWRILDFTNASPSTSRFINSLTGFLTLIGLTALLVGGVGVISSVRSYLDGKTSVIATLKCLGASGRIIFLTYLFQVLAIALVGIGIGLAFGAAAPPFLTALLGKYLPISARFSIDAAGLSLAALFGLATALAFAIIPIARAETTPPAALFRGSTDAGAQGKPSRRAILLTALAFIILSLLVLAYSPRKWLAIAFILGSAAILAAFRLAAWGIMALAHRMKRPRSPWLRLAVTNLYRPGSATPDVIMSLGLGLTVLSAIALVEANFTRQIETSLPPTTPAFFFLDVPGAKIDAFRQALAAIPGTGTFNETPLLQGRITEVNGIPAEKAARQTSGHHWLLNSDRGITWSDRQPGGAETVAGAWWPENHAGEPLMSVATEVTEFFGIGVGDSLTVNVLGRSITARIAHVRRVDWSSYGINFAMVFSSSALAGAPAPRLATIIASPAAEAEIQKTIPRLFPEVTLIRVKEALDTARRILSDISLAVRMIAGLAIAAGTLVLAGAIAAGHRRRIREAVIMKVLGATRRSALWGFALEYGLLGLITAAIACGAGTLTAWLVITRVLDELEWHFLPMPVFLTALLCTAITLALGFAGAWAALGKKAAPILRNE